MKNNRQIGLDGKIFITDCLKRSTYFVYALILFGAVGAFSDILKLLGASGAIMSSFSITLLIYDFIAMLVLIIVTFYAYFLECGENIPILKSKPIIFLCWFRMGYSVLLGYYICYRVMYIAANPQLGLTALLIYYIIYLVTIVLSIFSDAFIINILTRNIIRRSYEKSFHRLSSIGIAAQGLLPIAYIFARIFLKEVGDEWFTTSFCDFMRLCITPIFYISLWFIYSGAVKQVASVFGEVDTALREKRYQITYSEQSSPKKLKAAKKNKKKKKPAKKAAPVPAAAVKIEEEETLEPENITEEDVSDDDAAEEIDDSSDTDSDRDNNDSDSGADTSSGEEVSGESEEPAAPEEPEEEASQNAKDAIREEAMRIRQQVQYINPSATDARGAAVQDFDPFAVQPSNSQTTAQRPAAQTQQRRLPQRTVNGQQRLPQVMPGNTARSAQPMPQQPSGQRYPRQNNAAGRTRKPGGSVYYPPHSGN